MKGFSIQIPVRWGDLDANRHVANTSISAMMIEARMAFLKEKGFNHNYFESQKFGPAILWEQFNYLSEVRADDEVKVNLVQLGRTEDYRMMHWAQGLLLNGQKLAVVHELKFCWLDLETRKMKESSEEIRRMVDSIPRHKDFRILEKSDFRPSQRVMEFMETEF